MVHSRHEKTIHFTELPRRGQPEQQFRLLLRSTQNSITFTLTDLWIAPYTLGYKILILAIYYNANNISHISIP